MDRLLAKPRHKMGWPGARTPSKRLHRIVAVVLAVVVAHDDVAHQVLRQLVDDECNTLLLVVSGDDDIDDGTRVRQEVRLFGLGPQRYG